MSKNNTELLDCIELDAERADAAVIWLHGLGADGNDFVPIVPELGLPPDMHLRFVFPHAPVRPVTLNGGMAMRAWFDIKSLDRDGAPDEEGIRASQAQVEALIQQELDRGIASQRILIAGFSQGGAIALQTALRCSKPLGGVIALSTWLPLRESLEAERQAVNEDIPVFMAHGDFDPMVPFAGGDISQKFLKEAGYSVQWHRYPMQHQVCLEEIRDIGAFIERCLLPDSGSDAGED